MYYCLPSIFPREIDILLLHMVSREKIIILSNRYKRDSHVWFSFPHFFLQIVFTTKTHVMPCLSSLVVFLADVNYFTFNITLNWFHEIFWNVWNFVALSLLFWLTLEEEPNLEEFQNKARRNLFSETSHETSYLFLTERHTLKLWLQPKPQT